MFRGFLFREKSLNLLKSSKCLNAFGFMISSCRSSNLRKIFRISSSMKGCLKKMLALLQFHILCGLVNRISSIIAKRGKKGKKSLIFFVFGVDFSSRITTITSFRFSMHS